MRKALRAMMNLGPTGNRARRWNRPRPITRQLQQQTPEALEDRALLAAQLLASDAPSKTVMAGDTFTVPVVYQTLNDDGNPAALQTNLVSFNVHFDTSQVTWVETGFTTTEGITVVPNATRLESDPTILGDDSDPDTDTVLVASYSDADFALNLGWPNDATSDPIVLFTATFTANAGFTGTSINFSANQTGNVIGAGSEFEFQSNSLDVLPENQSVPNVGISGPPSVDEGGNAEFTISIDSPSNSAVTVQYSTVAGTGANGATSGVDFTAVSNQTVTFAAGETQKTVSITTIDDLLVEDTETFSVSLSNAVGATIVGSTATASIADNDVAPVVNVSVGDAVIVTEGGDLLFTVVLDATSSETVSVNYSASGFGSAAATSGTDFTATSGILTFSPGELTKQVTVSTLDDIEVEVAETVQLLLTGASGATIVDAQGLGVINDNDETTGTATIQGRKWNDFDADGNRDAGEPYLNGWTIQILNANGTIIGEQVTADIDFNGDNQIDPETETGWYQFSVSPGTYTLQEVQQDGWQQTWPDTPLEALAFQTDSNLQLRSTVNDFLNWGGRNEKWMLSEQGWHFMTPDGVLYRWNGSPSTNLTGDVVATFSPDYYNNLALLYDAEPAEFPTYTVGADETFTANFGNINTAQSGEITGRKWNDLNGDGQYSDNEPWLNGWTIQLTEADGTVVQSAVTMDIDVNGDGQITPATESGWYQFENVNAGDYVVREVNQDGWRQTSPLDADGVEAFELDTELNLRFSRSLFTDWGGLGERWMQGGQDDWYYITPNGQFYQWNGSPRTALTGTLVAELSAEFHTDPSLLYNAYNPLEVRLNVAPGQSITGVNFGNIEADAPPESGFAGVGNVSAAVFGSHIVLNGDNSNNGVVVYLNDAGWVTVAGLGDTTVQGSSSPWVVEGLTAIGGDLRVNLQGGDDALVVDGVNVGRHLAVTAAGNDHFFANDVTVARNLDYRSNSGDNTIVLQDSNVGSLARINTGSGSDAVYSYNTTVSGRTVLSTRAGADLFVAGNSTFGGNASFDAGTEDDQMAVLGETAFNGRLTIDGRGGNDAYDVGSGNTFARTPTVRRFESASIAEPLDLVDSVMDRLADVGLDDLINHGWASS